VLGVAAITILLFSSLIFYSTTDKPRSCIGCKVQLFNFVFMLIIMVIPFAAHIVAGGFMPPRLLIAMPYVIWLFSTIICNNKYAFIRLVSYCFVIILNLQILYVFSMYAATRELRQNHDRFMAQDLYLRIAKVHNNFDLNKKYYIHIYGRKIFNNPYPNVPNTVIDMSLFGCPNNVMARIYLYMSILGYSNLELASESKNTNFQQYYEQMPSWPNEGCVKVVGDITLIKLNDEVLQLQ
jgi:hypothetical protein